MLAASDWVEVAASSDLAAGQVIDAFVGDHEVVVWRTASGEVAATDARCAHQWVHLGAEGVVDGEELVCSAHFWRYGTDGSGCVLVNGEREPRTSIPSFPCRERNGVIEVAEALD